MATRKIQFDPASAFFLASAFPQVTKSNGSNFPAYELFFDASSEEKCYFHFKASDYASGNPDLIIRWRADSATSGDVVWGCRLAAITPDTDTQSVLTKAFATQQTVTDTQLGTTAARIMTCTISITNLDSLTSNDECFLEVSRVGTSGSDTMTGDACLIGLELQYSDS